MSNVIKNSTLSPKPKLIELTDMEELKKNISQEIIKNQNQLDDFRALENESKKILQETEQMVVELLEKANIEAREIIANAQDEVDVLRNEVYEEASQLREEAKNAGYQEGLKLANEEIKADRGRAIKQNELIIEEARKTKLEIINSAETDIVRLILAITKKVIAGELATNPDTIINIVKEAISYLDNPQNVKVYVNPTEIDKLLELLDGELLTDIGSEDITIDIKGDKRITKGGCLIESENGSVDARIETKLTNIEKGLLEVSGDE